MTSTNNKTRDSSKYGQIPRKSVLGASTLVLFMTSSVKDETAHIKVTPEKFGNTKTCAPSPPALFTMLKEVNKIIVKGAQLHDSLNELRLCGWVSPYTLLLSGPAEDMKVVKKAWIKRYLKNPLGFFIHDVGIVQDFVVELLPQSPFLSLKTALFDAISDLNNQKIFPTKDNLKEYLKKHYPELKLPDQKHIHDCLSRLIRERRLYHNGEGYFVISNDHVLNEAPAQISFKASPSKPVQLEGFVLSSSDKTTSSPDGVTTECDGTSTLFNVSNIEVDVSSAESGFPSCVETKRGDSHTSNMLKSLFKRKPKSTGKGDDQKERTNGKSTEGDNLIKDGRPSETKVENSDHCHWNKYKKRYSNVPTLTTDEIGVSHVHATEVRGEQCSSSKLGLENTCDETKVLGRRFNPPKVARERNNETRNTFTSRSISSDKSKKSNKNCDGPSNIKRSLSLESIEISRREVTFAVVGVPGSNVMAKESPLERSHSYGVGCRKINLKQTCSKREKGGGNSNREDLSYDNAKNLDTKNSFVTFTSSGRTNFDGRKNPNAQKPASVDDVKHEPKELPDLIFDYNGLENPLTFHKSNLTPSTVHDICSPVATSISLANELEKATKKDETVVDVSKKWIEKSKHGSSQRTLDKHGEHGVEFCKNHTSIEYPVIPHASTPLLSSSCTIIDFDESQFVFERPLDNEKSGCRKVPDIVPTSVSSDNDGKSEQSQGGICRLQNSENCSAFKFEGQSSLKVMGAV